MWRTLCLALTIVALDLPRVIRADRETIAPRAEHHQRNDPRETLANLREPSGDYDRPYHEDEYPRLYDQKDDVRRRHHDEVDETIRRRPYDRDKPGIRRRSRLTDGKRAVLIGKWRNNGEAYEPEWRDGDSMPTFPFSHFARPANGDEVYDRSRYYVGDEPEVDQASSVGRWTGQEEEGRRIGQEEEGRRIGQEVEGRRTGQEEEGRRIGQEVEGRRTGQEDEGRRTGQEEGRRTGQEEEGQRIGLEEEGRRTGLEEKGQRTGQEEKGRRIGQEEKGQRTGQEEKGQRPSQDEGVQRPGQVEGVQSPGQDEASPSRESSGKFQENRHDESKIGLDPTGTLTIVRTTIGDDRETQETQETREKIDAGSSRYREAFQMRSNEYEQELNDEEYLKPRPRKRRPPQNYEFALAANEAALRRENSSPEIASRRRNASPTTSSGVDFLRARNESPGKPSGDAALELKTLLKMQQEEGLSLSETLQRRNLTLSDLLRGKADVISALRLKNVDETFEEVEDASRVASDSLVKLSVTERPRWTARSQVELTTRGQVELTKSQVELKTRGQVELKPRGQVELKTRGQVELKARSPVELTTRSPVELTTMSPIELTPRSQVELTTRSQIVPLKATARIKQAMTSQTKSTTPTLQKENKSARSSDSNDIEPVGISPKVGVTSGIEPVVVTFRSVEIDSTNVATTMIPESTTPLVVISDTLESFRKDANSRLENSDDLKSYGLDEDEIMEFSDFPNFKKTKSNNPDQSLTITNEREITPLIEVQDNPQDTGSTLSVEQILMPTKEAITHEENKTHNEKPTGKIPSNDFRAFFESEYQNDFPTDVLNNDDTVVGGDNNKNKPDDYDQEKQDDPLLENHQTEISSTKVYEDFLSEVEPEARAEIFELFASSSSGKRLERLLKSRNMSLEELIALRQRGSSKVHLASVVHLRDQLARSSKTDYSDVLNNERLNNDEEDIKITNCTNSEDKAAKIEEKNSKSLDLENSVQKKETITIVPQQAILEDVENRNLTSADPNVTVQKVYKKQMNVEKNSRITPEISDLLTTFASLPFGKTEYRNYAGELPTYTTDVTIKLESQDENATRLGRGEILVAKRNESSTETEFREDFVKGDPSSIDMEATYSPDSSRTYNEMKETIEKKSLSKVKPSIIASGAILGVTIVVFLAILIACRIRQKQKYTYRNSFSRAVFQGPVTAARKLSNTSSLSAVMVNVVATSTTKRAERTDELDGAYESEPKSDIDNDSLDANDSWETIPDYLK